MTEDSACVNIGEFSIPNPSGSNLKTMKGLKMACLNIDRLLPKLDQLRVFCEESKIDLMAINETKLDYSIADNEVQITGFDIVRNDINKYGGGVCIYIRKDLNYKIRQDLMPEQLEIIVVEVKKPNSVPFFISTCIDLPVPHWSILTASSLFLK